MAAAFFLPTLKSSCIKSNSLTVRATGSRKRVQVLNLFSWTTIQKFYNAMPGEVTPCKNVYEAKMYTAALLGVEKNSSFACQLKNIMYVCSAKLLIHTTCGFFMSVRQLHYNIKQGFSILIFRKVFKGFRSRRISCFFYVLN